MKRAILFFSLILLGLNLSAQEFFSATAATADEAAHLRFMKMNKAEYEKRSAIWKVPSVVVRVIASAQSGAGYLDGHNYGAVLPATGITKYAKFSKVDDFDLVACSKPSRGIEAIALALSIMNSNTGGSLQNAEDYLQHVFGAGGELALMASEAELAYKAFTKKEVYLDSGYIAPSKSASYSNNSSVQTSSPVVQQNTIIETTPSYSNTTETTTPAAPSLMVKEKVMDEVENVVIESTESFATGEGTESFESAESFDAEPMATEATESFETESFATESFATEASELGESFDATPEATEMETDVPVENIVIRSNEETEEVDAMGRRIIKDPADNINAIETYNAETATGSKIIKKIEVENKASNVASEEVEQAVITQQSEEVNKRLEASNQQQAELKMAGQTEAQKREAEILRAEQMIIQQRKEMAERRAKKAAKAKAEEANGGGQ